MKYGVLLTLFAIGLWTLPSGVVSDSLGFMPVAYAQEKPAVEAAADEEDAELVDEEQDAEDDDGNFIPTEKINVDSSVSFPVDI